jgi:hypothetical protein
MAPGLEEPSVKNGILMFQNIRINFLMYIIMRSTSAKKAKSKLIVF